MKTQDAVKHILKNNGWSISFSTRRITDEELRLVSVYDNEEFSDCSIFVPKEFIKGYLIYVEYIIDEFTSAHMLRLLPNIFVKSFKHGQTLNEEILSKIVEHKL